MSPEKIADKIIKLLTKAESTTPEEAELLVEKAQELMQRHAITEAAIAFAKGEKEVKPEKVIKRVFHFEGKYARAHGSLVHRVARASGMRSVERQARSERSGHMNALDVDLIGFESEVENTELLLTSLLVQGAAACAAHTAAWKADNPGCNFNTTIAEGVSFTFGYAAGVGSKLAAARKRAEVHVTAEQKKVGTTSVALALVDRKKKVDEWVDHEYGRLYKVASRAMRPSSFQRGSAAGAAANTGGAGLNGSRGALGR